MGMGIIAFLFRMMLRLTVWALALVGALGVIGVLVWQDMRQIYPDESVRIETLNRQAASALQFLEFGGECDDVIADLNRYAAFGSGSAYIAAASLNHSGDCGSISGADIQAGMVINEFGGRNFQDLRSRLRRYRNRLLHLSGATGDTRFWRRYHDLDHCQQNRLSSFIFGVTQDGWDEEATYGEILFAQEELQYFCAKSLYELGIEFVDAENENVQITAFSLIRDASILNFPDANWWLLRINPYRENAVGSFGHRSMPLRSDGWRVCLLAHEYTRPLLRFFAGAGQEDAANEWMERRIPSADTAALNCLREVDDPTTNFESHGWRGGYDTPFWYAVHAIRTADEGAQNYLPEIEAQIGPECVMTARTIGEGLRPLLPGPPVDNPDLRQLVLDSINCQPDALRDSAEYYDYDRDQGGFYSPPELAVLPDYTPMIQRVRETEN